MFNLIENGNLTRELGKECYRFARAQNTDLNFVKALIDAERSINK